MSYELLDSIADSYNPLLFVACLIMSAYRWRQDKTALLRLIMGLALAYGVMFFDKKTQLWASFGWDYSTHSAVALVLVLFLIHRHLLTLQSILLLGSLLAYYALEMYQQYHTLADIVTTALVIGPMTASVLLTTLKKAAG